MKLCRNCMKDGAKPVEVGPEYGTQHDPHRQTISLCGECTSLLLSGDFQGLHDEFVAERVIKNEPEVDLR